MKKSVGWLKDALLKRILTLKNNWKINSAGKKPFLIR